MANSVCPKCGEDVPEDSIWLLRLRFYCSERCVRLAVAKTI